MLHTNIQTAEVHLCQSCFSLNVLFLMYVREREGERESLCVETVSVQKLFFSLSVALHPFLLSINNNNKTEIRRFSSSSSAALRHVFAPFCAFFLPVSLQLERFGRCWRLEGLTSGAGRVRRAGGGRGGGGDWWVGGPELQAAKVLNPGTLWRRWRRVRWGRRHGDGWRALLLLGVGGQRRRGGRGGRGSGSSLSSASSSSSSLCKLLRVDAERGDGLGAGVDALLLLQPRSSSSFALPQWRVRWSRLPQPLTSSDSPLSEGGEMRGGGLAGRGVLWCALLQHQAGCGLLRPLLGQRGGDGRGDGVHHLDPSDGDHWERRTHLEWKVLVWVTCLVIFFL